MILKPLKKTALMLLFAGAAAFPAFASTTELSPHSFEQMYALAAAGNVRALFEAKHRGLNINAVNRNGDTGLCVAARRQNAKAYNSFRLVGANPNHPCTWNIPHYQSFVDSRAVQAGASWKSTDYVPPVYSMEKSSSGKWMAAGAIVAVGGGAALLLSGGGGGGSDSNGSDSESSATDETGTDIAIPSLQSKTPTLYTMPENPTLTPASYPTGSRRLIGADFVPALAYQNMQRLRYINRTMGNLMQNDSSDKDERISVVSNNYYFDTKTRGNVSGYEEKLFGFSSLFDKKVDNNFRYGIGLGIYHADADFDNGVNRDDNLFEVYNPYWLDYERFGALIMPYAGFGDGKYERHEGAKKYKADLKAYYYGLNNRIYLKNQAAGLVIRPTAELNLNGMYQDDFSENGGLSVKGKNMFSAEAGLGTYISKEADFGENGRLNLKFGAMYYYELNDNAFEDLNARFVGMNGMYYLDGYDNRRSRGVISMKAGYELKGWNLYAEVMRLLEHDDNMVYNVGLKYNF